MDPSFSSLNGMKRQDIVTVRCAGRIETAFVLSVDFPRMRVQVSFGSDQTKHWVPFRYIELKAKDVNCNGKKKGKKRSLDSVSDGRETKRIKVEHDPNDVFKERKRIKVETGKGVLLDTRNKDKNICAVCSKIGENAEISLIICANCSKCYHEKCHEPVISDDFLKLKLPFLCSSCLSRKEKRRPKQWPKKPSDNISTFLTNQKQSANQSENTKLGKRNCATKQKHYCDRLNARRKNWKSLDLDEIKKEIPEIKCDPDGDASRGDGDAADANSEPSETSKEETDIKVEVVQKKKVVRRASEPTKKTSSKVFLSKIEENMGVKPKVNASLVWQWFRKVNVLERQCLKCDRVVTANSGSTSTMISHLAVYHTEMVSKVDEFMQKYGHFMSRKHGKKFPAGTTSKPLPQKRLGKKKVFTSILKKHKNASGKTAPAIKRKPGRPPKYPLPDPTHSGSQNQDYRQSRGKGSYSIAKDESSSDEEDEPLPLVETSLDHLIPKLDHFSGVNHPFKTSIEKEIEMEKTKKRIDILRYYGIGSSPEKMQCSKGHDANHNLLANGAMCPNSALIELIKRKRGRKSFKDKQILESAKNGFINKALEVRHSKGGVSNSRDAIKHVKSAVVKYFGAKKKIDERKVFAIQGRRLQSDGRVEYLVEWKEPVTLCK